MPYKYTGQEYDSSTGLYFYQARYYDPLLGRFVQPDTIVSDPYSPMAWNRYTYVMNNPLRYTDPTGHLEQLLSPEQLDINGFNNLQSFTLLSRNVSQDNLGAWQSIQRGLTNGAFESALKTINSGEADTGVAFGNLDDFYGSGIGKFVAKGGSLYSVL